MFFIIIIEDNVFNLKMLVSVSSNRGTTSSEITPV